MVTEICRFCDTPVSVVNGYYVQHYSSLFYRDVCLGSGVFVNSVS